MTKDEEEELELLELENQNAIVLRQKQEAEQWLNPNPGSTGSRSERIGTVDAVIGAAGQDIPLIGGAVGALREGIPGAIAEKTGQFAEQLPAGARELVKGAGIGTGMVMGMAGEALPKTNAEAALLAAAGPMGYAAGKVGQKLLPPLAKRPPNVVRAVQAALAADILPSVAQITQSKPMAALEEVVSRIPFIGKRIQVMREAQDAAYNDLRSKAMTGLDRVPASEVGAATQAAASAELDSMALRREKDLAKLHGALLRKNGPAETREAVGQKLDEIRVGNVEKVRAQAGKLYDEAEAAIPDARNKVDTVSLREVASKHIAKHENLPSVTLKSSTRKLIEDIKAGPGFTIIENAPNPTQSIVNEAGGMLGAFTPAEQAALKTRKQYTFSEIQTLRESINGLIQQEKGSLMPGQGSADLSILSELKASLDKDIKGFSDSLPGDLKGKFETATAYYRDNYKGVHANKTMESLARVAKDHPQHLYKMVIKPGNVSDIRRVKKAVGDAGFSPMRRRFVEDLVTGAEGEILSGTEITAKMAKYEMETLKEILSPEQLKQVAKYATDRQAPKFLESELEKRLRTLIFQNKGMYRSPEEVVKRVANGDLMTLKAVKKIVGNDGLKPYKRQIIEDIIGSVPEESLLPGASQTPTSLRISKTLQSYDENFLKEMFSPDELKQIAQIDDVKALLESQPRLAANSSGTAAALLTSPISMGLAGGFTFAHPVIGTSIAITTEMIARLYTSEAGRKLLIKGLDPAFAKNTAVAGLILAEIKNITREKISEDRVNQGMEPLKKK